MSDFDQEDHKGLWSRFYWVHRSLKLPGDGGKVCCSLSQVGFMLCGEGFWEEYSKLVEGFGAEGQDPVRAMGGSIAPIPKGGTVAASPGPDMPDWSIGRESRHQLPSRGSV